ncbi:unnamed protein product [Rhizophagus irregularis]|nr:unnamed protein product [Rhizophagus irregularis]
MYITFQTFNYLGPVTFIPCNPTLFIRNIKSPSHEVQTGDISRVKKRNTYILPHHLGRLIKTTTSEMTFPTEVIVRETDNNTMFVFKRKIRLFTPLRHSKKK